MLNSVRAGVSRKDLSTFEQNIVNTKSFLPNSPRRSQNSGLETEYLLSLIDDFSNCIFQLSFY